MDVDECNGNNGANPASRKRQAEAENSEASGEREKGASTAGRLLLATKRPAAADAAAVAAAAALEGAAPAAESKVALGVAPIEETASASILLHNNKKPSAEEGDHLEQENAQGDAATEPSEDHSENNDDQSSMEEESMSADFSEDDNDDEDPIEQQVAILRRNDPHVRCLLLELRSLDSNWKVVQTARALHENENVCSVQLFFNDEDCDFDLNWDPFLNELATREKLEKVEIWCTPTGCLLPLFRHHLFHALQQNANVQSLQLHQIRFSNSNAEGIVSFLDNAQNLTELKLCRCVGADNDDDNNNNNNSGEGATEFAAALRRNITIQTLNLEAVQNDLLCRIFQSLSSSESNSCLKRLSCRYQAIPAGALAEAMQQYLESPNSTLQCLELRYLTFDNQSTGAFNLFHGLTRSTSVKEVIFNHCWIVANSDVRDGVRQEEDEVAENHGAAWHLANLVRMKPNLSTLRVVGSSSYGRHDPDRLTLFKCGPFVEAVTEVLGRPDSPLRCLEVDMTGQYSLINTDRSPPENDLAAVLPAAAGSARLERFVVGNHHANDTVSENYQALLDSIPLFRAKSFAMTMRDRSSEAGEEERLLGALKRNYSFQSVEVERTGSDDNWFSDANQARLEFYLERNRKLALWTRNPKLVPQELWQYAIMLALEAGINSLYQSLLAVSGQGIGRLQHHTIRKRKRTQC